MGKMNCNVKIFSLLLLGLFIISCASCGIGTTKIADIVGHPRDYAGKEVTVSGEVTEIFSLFVVRYFVLRDATGELTVITDRPLPAKGEKIKVKGIVKEAFSIGTKTSLVLVEGTEKTNP
jgi:aspartyl/asparaginyl-tRNA synthetase